MDGGGGPRQEHLSHQSPVGARCNVPLHDLVMFMAWGRQSSISLRIHLKGGEYINPPFVHSAFSPLSNARGVLAPTLRSKTSS